VSNQCSRDRDLGTPSWVVVVLLLGSAAASLPFVAVTPQVQAATHPRSSSRPSPACGCGGRRDFITTTNGAASSSLSSRAPRSSPPKPPTRPSHPLSAASDADLDDTVSPSPPLLTRRRCPRIPPWCFGAVPAATLSQGSCLLALLLQRLHPPPILLQSSPPP
jgi:hypothetical protein